MGLPHSLLVRDGAFVVKDGAFVVTDAEGDADCCCGSPIPGYCVCRNAQGLIIAIVPRCCCPPPEGVGGCEASPECDCAALIPGALSCCQSQPGVPVFGSPLAGGQRRVIATATLSQSHTLRECLPCGLGHTLCVTRTLSGSGTASRQIITGDCIREINSNVAIPSGSGLLSQSVATTCPCAGSVNGVWSAAVDFYLGTNIGNIGASPFQFHALGATANALTGAVTLFQGGLVCNGSIGTVTDSFSVTGQSIDTPIGPFFFSANVQGSRTIECVGGPCGTYTSGSGTVSASISLAPVVLCSPVTDAELKGSIRTHRMGEFVAVQDAPASGPCIGCGDRVLTG